MKKICTLFVAFLCFIQISSAGTLTFGLPFVESFAKTLRIKNSECPKTLLNDKNIDYWCGQGRFPKGESKEGFQKKYLGFAQMAARGAGAKFQNEGNWEIVGETITKIDRLDGKQFGVKVVFFDDDYEIAFLTSANVSVTTQTNTGVVVTVLRYLCAPSENGRARVFGTIKNTSNRALEFLRFNVEFFDGSRFVGQESSYVRAEKLTPNSETTFETIARTPPYTRCEISFEDSSGKLAIKLP